MNSSNRKSKRRNRGGRKASSSIGRAIDSRANTYGNALSQMRRDLSWLMAMVNVERKYLDILFNGNTISNAIGNQSLLNGCVTGNSGITRNGQSTKAVELILDLIATVGVTTPVVCRFCIILDKAVNGATTGVASIFQAAVDGANNYTTAQRNVATVGSRIVFIKDMMFELDTVNNVSFRIKTAIKLNFHTRYNTGNGGGVADISENALYLLFMSNAAATQPTFTGSARFLFVDN
jgi:hypothetical protein